MYLNVSQTDFASPFFKYNKWIFLTDLFGGGIKSSSDVIAARSSKQYEKVVKKHPLIVELQTLRVAPGVHGAFLQRRVVKNVLTLGIFIASFVTPVFFFTTDQNKPDLLDGMSRANKPTVFQIWRKATERLSRRDQMVPWGLFAHIVNSV